MARPSRLKKEGKYWVAYVRGQKRSFGNSEKVSRLDAQKAFANALAEIETPKQAAGRKLPQCVAAQLVDDYLIWLKTNCSADHYTNRKSILRQFLKFKLPRTGRQVAVTKAVELIPQDFQDYIDGRQPLVEPGALWHDFTAIKACWNWAAGTKGHPASHLPTNHRPFAQLKAPTKFKKELSDADLMTPTEKALIFARSKTYQLDELFTVLDETGCRPGEICGDRVKAFDPTGRQLVLYKHKNDKKQGGKPRVISLPPKSFEIIQRFSALRPDSESHIFMGPGKGCQPRQRSVQLPAETIAEINTRLAAGETPTQIANAMGLKKITVQRVERGKPWPSETAQSEKRKQERHAEGRTSKPAPWTTKRLGKWFRLGCRGDGVRESLTLYDFRHLFISEALRAGETIFNVAAAVGTSVKVIQDTYGHFFRSDLADMGDRLAKIRAGQQAALIGIPVPLLPTPIMSGAPLSV